MVNKDCIFCRIIEGKIATDFVYEDRDLVVFADINPKSRIHLLVVPRQHIRTFLDLSSKNISVLTKMVKVVQRIIREQKVESGYQIVFNGGRYQHIPHMHWHLLGD